MNSRNPEFRMQRRLSMLAGGALAATALAGCSGMNGIHSASAAVPGAGSGKVDAKLAKAVARAEAVVAKAPQDAASRAELGHAYLAAGRFGSASVAFNDALALGDRIGRTALGLALARIGLGQNRQAVAVLDQWRDQIPAGDLGLALALAGESSRGVAILADAVRGGDGSAKLRQNLAYAYALDGRWQEAKRMAAQDVPAEQIDRRLATWALSMLPDRAPDRVAALVGAPVGMPDAGQPAALALNTTPEPARLALREDAPEMALPAAAELPAAVAAAEPVPQPRLGAVTEANSLAQKAAPAPAAPSLARTAPVRTSVAQAFTAAAEWPAPFAAPAPAPARVRPVTVATMVPTLPRGTHYVQLGAFSSYAGAKRAWGYYNRRNPALAAYRMNISEAVVDNKRVWRVAVAGLSGRMAANTLCARVKSSGGACFAYARPLKSLPAGVSPVLQARAEPAGKRGPQRARR